MYFDFFTTFFHWWTSDEPMTQHFSSRGSSLTTTVSLFNRGQIPFYFKSHAKGVTSPPPPPHITKLNPSQPGNRWALNLGCTTWVGVVRRIVRGGGAGNHSPQWKKVTPHLWVFPPHTPPHSATSFLEHCLFLSLSSSTLWGRTEEPDTIWSKTSPPSSTACD